MTASKNPVFQKTYENYLEQLRGVPLAEVAAKLGAAYEAGVFSVELFGRRYHISHESITGPDGEKPGFEICVILSKYLLMCPEIPPRQKEWVSYKDFKDAAPLINYFTNEVEGAIAGHYTGRLKTLKKAADALNGSTPDLDVNYDLTLQFAALPKVPLILLFNDADDAFPAACTLLFQRRTEQHLDAECIAMLGWRLFRELKTARR